MTRYDAYLTTRITLDQRQRLDFLADHLEVGQADLVRALIDGVTGINGIDLAPSLFRLAQAAPANYEDVELVESKPVRKARKAAAR